MVADIDNAALGLLPDPWLAAVAVPFDADADAGSRRRPEYHRRVCVFADHRVALRVYARRHLQVNTKVNNCM